MGELTIGAALEMIDEPALTRTATARRRASHLSDQEVHRRSLVGAQMVLEPRRSCCVSHGGPRPSCTVGPSHEHPTRKTRQVTAAPAQSSGADAARPRIPGAARGQPAPLLAQAQAQAGAGERRCLKASLRAPEAHRGALIARPRRRRPLRSPTRWHYRSAAEIQRRPSPRGDVGGPRRARTNAADPGRVGILERESASAT